MKHLQILATIALCLSSATTTLANPTLKKDAAKVFEIRKKNTVTLTATRKKDMEDTTFNISALCINNKGLLVASLSQLERKSTSGVIVMGSGGPADDKDNPGELTRVAMIMNNGSEVEAKLVLKDPELDLVFIQLLSTEAEKITLPEAPVAAKEKTSLLDDVLMIDRLGPNMQRVASCSLGEISAIIETPQKLYAVVPSAPSGAAVYTLKGELLGFLVNIKNKVVIVPTETIQKLAEGIKTTSNE